MRTLWGQTNQHNGIDLVGTTDGKVGRVDYIKAHTSGTVSAVGYDVSAGNFVQIDIGNNVIMVYYHLKDKSITVKMGDKVKKGDIIGYMGVSGNVTGAHLHFGIKDNGKWVNPEPYLEADYPIKGSDSGSSTNSSTATTIKAGDKLNLLNEPSYNSSTSKSVISYRTGAFYVWSAEVVNGRIRITNHPSRVGVAGQVTCWIDAPKGIEAVPEKQLVKGAKCKINEGAKDLNRNKVVATFACNRTSVVKEVGKDYVVVSYMGVTIAKLKHNDITLV